MDRWQEKVAVVTGASAGIGSAVCLMLANAGMRVVGLARRAQLVDKLQSTIKGSGSIVSRQCDVSSAEDVKAAFEWIENTFGCVHVLINNAGVLHDGQITEVGNQPLSEAALLLTIDVNLKGTILCAKHAVTSMKKHDFDGHIVNVNSLAGHYVPFASTFNVYPSTKHAITAFTSSLASELAHFNSNIKTTMYETDDLRERCDHTWYAHLLRRVSCGCSDDYQFESLSPGLVATDMTTKLTAEDGSLIPCLKPEDIANAVVYALSTPPNVNINELTISPVRGLRL